MTFTQFLLLIFLIFALTRVIFRFRDGILHFLGFLFWSIVFGAAIILVLFPQLSSTVAKIVGIGRGSDVVLYISVVLLFYLIFRLYIYIEDLRRDITELVRKKALDDEKNAK
jgi:small membrane protein